MSFNINNMLNSVQHYTYRNNSAAVVYNNPYVFVASNNTVNMLSDSTGCAISSNGQYILSCHYTNGAYLSTNYGSTFTKLIIPISILWSNEWTCTISGNGQYMAIGNVTGYISISTDYGSNFIENTTGSLSKNWRNIKMSYTGQYCLASDLNFIYLSSNSGETFAVTKDTTGTSNSVGNGFNTNIAMSKTGQYMVCIKNVNPIDSIKISTDYGVTWKQKNFAVLNNFSYSCAMSEDGQTIYIGSYNPKLYKITNISADNPTITEIGGAASIGCFLILLATDPLYIFISDYQYGKMWYSINGGTNFTQVVTTTRFQKGAISSDKKYIIGNNIYNALYKLYISNV